MTDRVELKAPCKVNLLLRVLAREESGFHQLETIFALTTLHDTLVASRRDGTDVSIDVRGADVGPDMDNLAVRAARLVLESTRQRLGVHLELTKAVPAGGGLGGGSSDAAAALLATNQLAGNPIPQHELLQLGARLGSDVPFFLTGAPLALGRGGGAIGSSGFLQSLLPPACCSIRRSRSPRPRRTPCSLLHENMRRAGERWPWTCSRSRHGETSPACREMISSRRFSAGGPTCGRPSRRWPEPTRCSAACRAPDHLWLRCTGRPVNATMP